MTPDGVEGETRNMAGTAVALGDHAVLLRGPSGAGKSDLALRLLDRGFALIADDRTVLTPQAGNGADEPPGLVAAPPPGLAGLLEVRGVGVLRLPHRSDVALSLVVDLVADTADRARLPSPMTVDLLGVPVRQVVLNARPASAPIVVERLLTSQWLGETALHRLLDPLNADRADRGYSP